MQQIRQSELVAFLNDALAGHKRVAETDGAIEKLIASTEYTFDRSGLLRTIG